LSPGLRGGAHVSGASGASAPADRRPARGYGGRAHRGCQAGFEARRRAGWGRRLRRVRALRALRGGAGSEIAAVWIRVPRARETGGGARSGPELGRRRSRAFRVPLRAAGGAGPSLRLADLEARGPDRDDNSVFPVTHLTGRSAVSQLKNLI